MSRNAKVVLKSVEKGMNYIAMQSSWLMVYVTSAIGDVHGNFLTSVDEQYYFISQFKSGSYTYALEWIYNVVKTRTISATQGDEYMGTHGYYPGNIY